MDIRIQLCLIAIIYATRTVVQADIGDVNIDLQYQLRKCISRSSSVFSAIAQQLWCLKASLFRCLLFHEPTNRQHEETEMLCGVINSGQQIKPHTWHIALTNKYSLYIDFLHFLLPMSPHCKSTATVSIKSLQLEQPTHTYCGYRMPWHISFFHSHARVQCIAEYNTPQGFHFVMTFQSFDIQLSSVSLVQLNEHELHFKAFTVANLAIGKALSFHETEIQLHIVIMVCNKIVLQHSPSALLKLKIYDGPGPLSPEIITPNSRVELSSYQGFVTYSTVIHDKIIDAYTNANNHSYINSLYLNWTSNFHDYSWYKYDKIKNSENCLISMDLSFNLRGTSGQCWLLHTHNSMIIDQMTFTGVNMLRHSPSNRSPTCQYGGLFVFFVNSNITHHSLNYITICSNISDKTIFPINRPQNLRDDLLVLTFITFDGYSHGFVDITADNDQRCFGSNIAISRGPSCSSILSSWRDEKLIPGRTMSVCTDVWLLNEIDMFESLPVENCTFTLDHVQLGFPVATFKMSVYNYLIDHTDLSFDSGAESSLEMDVEMKIFQQNSANSVSTNVSFTVSLPAFEHNEYSFDFPHYTIFSVRLLGYNKFPTFAIRVHFIERRICSPQDPVIGSYNHNMNTSADDVIHIIRENISDVYLSPRHPYDELLSSVYQYEGYNRGTCRSLVKGHKCSHSVSHYHIINIHYPPHTSLVTPQEVDISLKKTPNCSTDCSLNIGILEYIETNSSRKIRYHEWRGVYRVTWQIIAAKSRGYLVTINSTCLVCTAQLCDVAIALGLPLTSNKVLPDTNNVYGKYLDQFTLLDVMLSVERVMLFKTFQSIFMDLTSPSHPITSSDLVYGNWYDAHAYCVNRNSTLFTLPHWQSGHLLDLVHAADDGWKSSHKHYFAGLHRANSVSTK